MLITITKLHMIIIVFNLFFYREEKCSLTKINKTSALNSYVTELSKNFNSSQFPLYYIKQVMNIINLRGFFKLAEKAKNKAKLWKK